MELVQKYVTVINLLNKSKIENADALFKEIDEHNMKRGLI